MTCHENGAIKAGQGGRFDRARDNTANFACASLSSKEDSHKEASSGTARRMSNPIPKRHHFVPEMLQKRFVNSEGGLWFFNKQNAKAGIIGSKPGNIFLEGHLYSAIADDGTKDPSLELFYSELESQADPIVERIVQSVRQGNLPTLSKIEKTTWDEFYFHQYKRVPDFHRELFTNTEFSGMLDEAIEEFSQLFREVYPHEREHLNSPEVMKRLNKNAIIGSLRDGGLFVPGALASKGLAIAVISKPTKSFALSSYPFARLGQKAGGTLSDPETELWFPIAQDVAVSPFGRPGSELLHIVSDGDIRRINLQMLHQSTIIASGSKQLITSLINAC